MYWVTPWTFYDQPRGPKPCSEGRAPGGGADRRRHRPDGRPQFRCKAARALLDLTHVAEVAGWDRSDGEIRLGAGVPYARIITELAAEMPALAIASRTVGSPQIRNRATVAGNLGTASPAGDAHPPLLATGATVEAESVRGLRLIPIDDFFLGVKRQALADDELIRAVRVPVARGPQQFAKIGTRNAMVIAVCTVAVALDPAAGGSARASAPRRPRPGGPPKRRASPPNPCPGRAGASTMPLPSSAPGSPPRRHRSTTCGARPTTGARPWPCLPAGP